MPGKSSNSLLSLLADLDDPAPKDFDPEDERQVDSDGDDNSDASVEEDLNAARDHYAPVGKSKLRKPEQPSLGPRYVGSRVSRDAALLSDDDEDDDPFARALDGNSSDDESEAEGDMSADEKSLIGDSEDMEDDESEGSEADEEKLAVQSTLDKSLDSDILRQSQALQRQSTAASLSKGAQEEVAKGRAIQKQRAAFDALLGVRIKLQKALIGGNTLAALAQQPQTDGAADDLETAFQAAESAAYSLWSGLTSLREELLTARAGSKRSHAAFSLDTPTAELLAHTQSQDRLSSDPIDATLERWFAKSHVVSATIDSRNKLGKSSAPTSAKSILTSALADKTHLLKRARTPRSCAPVQLARRTAAVEIDNTVYDDADMYAVLLTTLLEQKGSSAVVAVGQAPHAIRREAKTRKVVDTKASKGRKLRYTVHEKLLNYMAPRETGTWGQKQVDELFGSLFGQRMALDENDHADVDEEDEDMEAEAGLLFGR